MWGWTRARPLPCSPPGEPGEPVRPVWQRLPGSRGGLGAGGAREELSEGASERGPAGTGGAGAGGLLPERGCGPGAAGLLPSGAKGLRGGGRGASITTGDAQRHLRRCRGRGSGQGSGPARPTAQEGPELTPGVPGTPSLVFSFLPRTSPAGSGDPVALFWRT